MGGGQDRVLPSGGRRLALGGTLEDRTNHRLRHSRPRRRAGRNAGFGADELLTKARSSWSPYVAGLHRLHCWSRRDTRSSVPVAWRGRQGRPRLRRAEPDRRHLVYGERKKRSPLRLTSRHGVMSILPSSDEAATKQVAICGAYARRREFDRYIDRVSERMSGPLTVAGSKMA